jgi:AcrR family transcriptional regulator
MLDSDSTSSREAHQAGRRLDSDEPRERLIDAAAELIGQGTYTTTTVAQISRRARVSSATFYTLFRDKEQCLLAAHRRAAEALLERIGEQGAVDQDRGAARGGALAAIVELARSEPDVLSLLFDEVTLATRSGLQARDALISEIETLIERERAAAHQRSAPELPARVVLGAALRLLVRRARDPEASLGDLRDGLERWLRYYERSGEPPPWQTLTPVPDLKAGPATIVTLSAPQRPGRGRSNRSREQSAANQRERILHATAAVSTEQGYAATSVADIVTAAGVAREVFYTHFRDKQDAFMTAYETGFQGLMSTTVAAFFTSAPWPERVWSALRVYADFMANYPTFAYLGMVESHTVSQELIDLVDERVMAFTVFLEEGQRPPYRTEPLPDVVPEAIAMAIYEVTSHMLRHGRGGEIPGLVPLIAYVVLSPYLGATEATRFVEERLRADGVAYV